MLEDDLFKLFEKTGEVGVYLLYNAIRSKNYDGTNQG